MADQIGVYSKSAFVQLSNSDFCLQPKPTPARYYNFNQYGLQMPTTSAAGTANLIVAYPIVIARRTVVDRCCFRQGTALVGSLMRYAIYDSDPTLLYPRNMVLDLGEFDVSAGAGVQESIINFTFNAGLYWIAKIQNNGKIFYVYSSTGHLAALGFPNNITYNHASGLNLVQAYGALPNPFTAGATYFYSAVGSFLTLYRVVS